MKDWDRVLKDKTQKNEYRKQHGTLPNPDEPRTREARSNTKKADQKFARRDEDEKLSAGGRRTKAKTHGLDVE